MALQKWFSLFFSPINCAFGFSFLFHGESLWLRCVNHKKIRGSHTENFWDERCVAIAHLQWNKFNKHGVWPTTTQQRQRWILYDRVEDNEYISHNTTQIAFVCVCVCANGNFRTEWFVCSCWMDVVVVVQRCYYLERFVSVCVFGCGWCLCTYNWFFPMFERGKVAVVLFSLLVVRYTQIWLRCCQKCWWFLSATTSNGLSNVLGLFSACTWGNFEFSRYLSMLFYCSTLRLDLMK